MFRCSLISCLIVFVICSYCGKDFKSLGRHIWRCKDKVKTNSKDKNDAHVTGDKEDTTSTTVADMLSPRTNCSLVKCSCVKICNGRRGLKMHQRSCRVIKDLSGELSENQCNEEFLPFNERAPIIDGTILTSVGIKFQSLLTSGSLQTTISRHRCPFTKSLRRTLM